MTLRRFPWKQPRLSDNSYKLFVSPPTPGTPIPDSEPRRTSENRPKSTTDVLTAAEQQRRRSAPNSGQDEIERETSGTSHHTHHHHHHGQNQPQSEPVTHDDNSHLKPSAAAESYAQTAQKQEVVKGPWRLLRILPRESRHIIGRMLKVDLTERATLTEVLEDEWVVETPVCRQEEAGKCIRAPGHSHTLEPATAPTPAPSEK